MADEGLAIRRRDLLALASLGVAATAGCTEATGEDDGSDDAPEFGYGGVPTTADVGSTGGTDDDSDPQPGAEEPSNDRDGSDGGSPDDSDDGGGGGFGFPGFGGGDGAGDGQQSTERYGRVGYGMGGYG